MLDLNDIVTFKDVKCIVIDAHYSTEDGDSYTLRSVDKSILDKDGNVLTFKNVSSYSIMKDDIHRFMKFSEFLISKLSDDDKTEGMSLECLEFLTQMKLRYGRQYY